MSKKWTSPLEEMMASGSSANTVEKLVKQKLHEKMTQSTEIVQNENQSNDLIIKLNPSDCFLWKYKDRPKAELGDLEQLALDIQTNGQLQPGIVRPIISKKDANKKYEIIVGERRWRACQILNTKFSARILANLTDAEAAIYQSSENDQREALSDYARGINYKQLIDNKIITAKELQIKLRKSQSYIRNLLSFSRISNDIWDAIVDPTRITARTAYEMARLLEKGDNYKQAILKIAPKLRTGTVGEKRLENLINEALYGKTDPIDKALEVLSNSGRHLFTWRKDSNGNRSVTFPKEIRKNLDFDSLEKLLLTWIDNQLKGVNKK